jgi:glucose-6-phosphate-specific signal transduction histidine kinase
MKYGAICLPMRRKKTIRQIKEELNSRIEIQQRSLETYSKEIFDNIGQVLSLIKFQLSGLPANEPNEQVQGAASRKLLAKAIADLRNLTKQLSPDEIVKKGFAASIEYELKRLAEAGLCKVDISIDDNAADLDDVKELVVFCILQQLSNPVLNVFEPGYIGLHIQNNERAVSIEFIRKSKGEPLFLEHKELEKFNHRLSTINSSMEYRADQKTLQLTINL